MNEYEGAMPDSFFRVLTPDEEATFRKSAHDIWSTEKPEGFSMFHPVVRDEWRKLDELEKVLDDKRWIPMAQPEVNPETEKHICSICGSDYTGWGHNAEPVNNGRCCDSCNDVVIMHRINNLRRSRKAK